MIKPDASARSASSLAPPKLLERMLDAVLTACRAGTLEQLCRQHDRAAAWWLRRIAAPLLWVTDPTQNHAATSWAAEQGLRWALSRLRPDAAAAETPIPRHAWLGATPWRPMLALACHYGLTAVPAFPDRYRARADEPAFEQLCGLWEVAPSSFYRYVERGRQLLAVELGLPLTPERALSLADFGAAAQQRERGLDESALRDWHQAQVRVLQGDEHPAVAAGALWHAVKAGDVDGALEQIEHHGLRLAASPLTDAMLARVDLREAPPARRLDLTLARARLAWLRGQPQDEQLHLAQALRMAVEAAEPVGLGQVYCATGRFHEGRDPDRALADYREALAFFEQAAAAGTQPPPLVQQGMLRALISLAWRYMLRNDPRAASVLERAQICAGSNEMPAELEARLLLAQGEYAHRQGQLEHAIEHTLRAIQIYERSAQQHPLVRAWGSLAMLYGQAHDIEQALCYAHKVFAVTKLTPVDPETLAAIELNLGVAFFWRERLNEAIAHYQSAAQIALAAGLQTVVATAHFNLAEAYFKRLQQSGQREDELQGDAYARSAESIWTSGKNLAAAEATRNLKHTLLGDREHLIYDRLLPQELAAHFDEMKAIEMQRKKQETADNATDRVEARLGIAHAYLRIAVKEREAALRLIAQQGLQGRFDAHLQSLRATFEAAHSRQEQLAQRWIETQAVPSAHVPGLLHHLLSEGHISKSVCATLCGVSPATASKYLADLSCAGLLTRLGKGAATRYTLP